MVEILLVSLIVIAVLVIVTGLLLKRRRKQIFFTGLPLSVTERELMEQHVPFYINLENENKILFESRVKHFLEHTRITGVNAEITELDRVLVGASAIIPIFGFHNWEYTNLNEVLVYPESFNESFEQEGSDRQVLGMVGSGALSQVMILSQHELRQGFLNKTGKTNTAIHEFVHLVDKTDGYTDGLPENLIPESHIRPWLQLMHRKINEIKKGKSDINPYGATSEAEFFAVASEYFFERPDLLKSKHPRLYELLCEIFQPPAEDKVQDSAE
ncbi:MAG: M90 family metallopeptidase [Flavisolibacter sp.]